MKETPEERRNLKEWIADLLKSKNMQKLAFMVPVAIVVQFALSPFVTLWLCTAIDSLPNALACLYQTWTSMLITTIQVMVFAIMSYALYRFLKWW